LTFAIDVIEWLQISEEAAVVLADSFIREFSDEAAAFECISLNRSARRHKLDSGGRVGASIACGVTRVPGPAAQPWRGRRSMRHHTRQW
jgi:hypothetical protein